MKLQSALFDNITESYESSQVKLIALVKTRYRESLDEVEKRFSNHIDKLIEFVANIDVAVSNAKCAKSMHLTRPIIEEGNFYEAIACDTPSSNPMKNQASISPMTSFQEKPPTPNTTTSHSTQVIANMSKVCFFMVSTPAGNPP